MHAPEKWFPALLSGVLAAVLHAQTPATQGKRSFQELLIRKDANIIEELQNDAYVCFLPHGDEFFIARYSTPNIWEKSGNVGEDGEMHGYGVAAFSFYVSGQLDQQFGSSPGDEWKAWGHETIVNGQRDAVLKHRPTFSSAHEYFTLFVTDSEMGLLDTKLAELDGFTGNITVRLSTGRYLIVRGAKEMTGRCDIYRRGKRQ